MAKGYWVIAWKSISNPAAVERYVAPATEAILSNGGRVLAGGEPAKAYEQGTATRLVIVEFDSLQQAIAAYEHPDYQATLVHLAGAAERDVRVIEGAA
ncbi:DUF1330 domain-containing protein [Lysobacter sp. A6]|uniref:DUF1330 domain-containing protein n=1 Tax=Noviluteimonas lactosilytica TaxID=2888523 RepID=A0ABS8JLI7_9GAMM|nr:DUF1330 domain-containing protein [Lysobacter lactosilyticus]MCC8364473.1 DUF1330 domain-containing protein [Lysobacter lactosilyticus]